jgi:benzoyl-CoA 2,3-dioxygenase component B
MLREEGFHLGTGHMGLQRIVKGGKVPIPVLQRYVNKWLSTAYDLFGKDSSSSAEWFYVWGLKGRYDEAKQSKEVDKAHLNELSREMYRDEVEKLLQSINRLLPAGEKPLTAPDLKFHRSIGEFAGKRYSVTGEEMSEAAYERHLAETLPSEDDRSLITSLQGEKDWIASRDTVSGGS